MEKLEILAIIFSIISLVLGILTWWMDNHEGDYIKIKFKSKGGK